MDKADGSRRIEERIGLITIVAHDEVSKVAEIVRGESRNGLQNTYVLSGPDNLCLTVVDTSWETDERDVYVIKASGPPQMDALIKQHRLSVNSVDQNRYHCALKQARVDLSSEPYTVGLFPADEDDHTRGTGVNLAQELGKLDARVGPRGRLIGDVSSHRNQLCAEFPRSSTHAPLMVFVITRVLPILHMVYQPGSEHFDDFEPPKRSKGEKQKRVYVVLLDGESTKGHKTRVYVGQTGKHPADRFREHKVGYRDSKKVKNHGVRLMPELFPSFPPTRDGKESERQEKEWAECLRKRGYCVKGGH